jgi:hypothetical protein
MYRLIMNSIILWYIAAIIASAYAGILVKQYTNDSNIINIYVAVFLNSFLIFCYVKIFADTTISSSYSIIKILSILIVAIVGVIIYQDTLTIHLVMGILFGIISIYLLSL